MWTKRPKNKCKDCGYTWYPRGKNLSRSCPECGSRNTTIALGCREGCGCLILIVVGFFVLSALLQIGK
jgi:hypothetical protein